jgi:hypothetical protein
MPAPLLLAVLVAAQQPNVPPRRYGMLVSERVVGTRRICVYNNPGSAPPPQDRQRQRAVGRAEPCPARDPGPPPPRPVQIPAMAMLSGQRAERGQRVCVYTYLRQEYSRVISAGRTCPLTPHFFD